ncbi:MAG: hypothetical protein ACK559_40835, partial [bacterium]
MLSRPFPRELGSCIDPLRSRYVARPSSCPLWRASSLELVAWATMVRTASSAASLIADNAASCYTRASAVTPASKVTPMSPPSARDPTTAAA